MTASPRRRIVGLAPMIDVVFLLLVFFLLAAREQSDLAISLQESGGESRGRLWVVDVLPDAVRFNGTSTTLLDIGARVNVASISPEDLMVVRPRDHATVQRVVDALASLRDAGVHRLAVAP